ncbi:MAG: PmoA family protein [Planctomycetia bacterium]|nr:PmoA family protein [Planctomycetia bacterium]
MRCRWLPVVLLLSGGLHPRLAHAEDVTIAPGKDAIEFKAGSGVVAKYLTDPKYSKPFMYPMLAPGGVEVTRGWPMVSAPPMGTTDHVHQKSVWFCHGDVIPEGIDLKVKTTERNGKGVDFWSEAKDKDGKRRHGHMVCVKVGEPKQHAKHHASIETHNEWRTPDGVKIMDEVRVIHLIDTPTGRLFVFEITLKATVCPIIFGDTKEGSFGIRVRDEFRMEKRPKLIGGDGLMTNSLGKATEKDIWGLPGDWVDTSGKVDGKEFGVTVFDHPKNPRPSWHARGYGLVAANPFGRKLSGFPSQKDKTDLLKIEKGGELKLKYGVYAHTGNVKTGKVAETYSEFKK